MSGGTEASTQTDPTNEALDRQIDAFRDQLVEGNVQAALAGFRALLQSAPPLISGKNLFRVKANIGRCHQRLGEDDQAAEHLLAAFAHAPHEPKAIANRALALLLQRQPQEAYDYAQAELARAPGNELLASYAVQAAAHLPVIADPFTGIAPGLRERREVIFAELFFYQRRGRDADWLRRTRMAVRQYPDDDALALIAAQAEIHAYAAGRAFATTYQIADKDRETLSAAAERLQAHWDRRRAYATPRTFDEIYTAVGAMLGWHLAHVADKAIVIAEQIIALGIRDRPIMVNVGQVLAANDQDQAAQRAFALIADSPEARWAQTIHAVQKNDWPKVTALLEGADVPEEEQCVAAAFKALAPLMASTDPADDERIKVLIGPAQEDTRALIAVARSAKERGFSAVAESSFRAAMNSITAESPKEARFITANYARNDDNHTAVINLLDPIIAHNEPGDALIWLAEAHAIETPRKQRNKAFFDGLPQRIKRQPPYASPFADYLLNVGSSHLDEAMTVLKQLREEEPARAYHIIRLAQAYRRKNDMVLFEALCRSIDLAALKASPLNRAYIAHILRDGSRPADALREALAALRGAPDNPKVALAYVGLLIGSENRIVLPVHERVAEDTYVRLTGPHNEIRSFIIDRGAAFHGIDVYAPDHPFARQLRGKAVGDVVSIPKPVGPDELWTVAGIKDKYLHILHTIMEEFEQRFAGFDGLARVSVDTANLSPVLEHVREYAEANRALAKVYTEQHLPLEFAARMMGGDVLSFAGYVGRIGEKIFTCLGSEEERRAAIAFAKDRAGAGAVLDSYTACLAASFNLLPLLKLYFGRLIIASATIDMLDDLLLRQRDTRGHESMTIFWYNGQYGRHITTDVEIDEAIAEYERVKGDLLTHATALPGHFPDNANTDAAALAERAGEEPFFPIYLAAEHGMVFLSEDRPTRLFAQLLAQVETTWLQPVLAAAKLSGVLASTDNANALAELAAQRHSHIAIGTQDLTALFHADPDGMLRQFKKLAVSLGGPNADFSSHVKVVAETIHFILHPLSVRGYAATGVLLENLIKQRTDYAEMLGCVAALLCADEHFIDYFSDWIRGHFLPLPEIVDAFRRYDAELRLRFPAPEISRLMRRLRSRSTIPEAA